MVHTRKFLCCILLMFMAQFASSMTANGSGQSTFTYFSNFNGECASSSCWDQSPGAPLQAVNISADNGRVYAVDGSCNGYSYADYPINKWTKHPEWGCVYQLHLGGDGNLYAIHHHISAGDYFGRWNGSGWTDLSCCFLGFAVAPGNNPVMVAHDANGTIWVSTNFGQTFATKPWCNDISEAVEGYDASGNPSFEVTCSNNTFYQYTNSTWVQLPGNGVLISHGSTGMYMVGMQGKANHFNGTSWDNLAQSGLTSIASFDGLNVWAVGPTVNGNSVYRFSETGLRHTRSISGNVNCDVPPPYDQQICNPAVHTVSISAGIGGKFGAVSSYKFTGAGPFSASASVDQNDLFTCVESSGNCKPGTTGSVICSEAGQVFADLIALGFNIELAQVLGAVVGVSATHDAFGYYTYTIKNYCSNVPDASIGTNESTTIKAIGPNWSYFLLEDVCVSFSGHQPFICGGTFQGWNSGQEIDEWSITEQDPPLGNNENGYCTSNP